MTQEEKELEFYKNLQIMSKVYDDIDKNKQTPTELSEQKDKLLKYLCAALPYGVKAKNRGGKLCKVTAIAIHNLMSGNIKEIKPYLRPMSSMTNEEFNEWYNAYYTAAEEEMKCSQPLVRASIIGYGAKFDWLLKNHFDSMDLIPIGAAIEVTEENNPYKD